ncbi:uncharacterized protein LOC129594249 [Paramacrobiotus metropolitanus]|uniref:uncharacterized protein LOC129594249 n=1 Tax=Paramacrobiotus metropolitanus TaxID=2943436 RepID=UPI002445C5DC|nr:uncharacterized protein LOC129594249 [Paramacrobiotus metropolitanus]
MSYLNSWIILFGCVGLITAQGFYGGAGNGFGGYGGGGSPQGGGPQGGGGQYGGPQSQMQQAGLGMPQGRSLTNNGNPQMPQQPNIQPGSGGMPVIFTNPQTAAADKAAAAGVQTPPMTAPGQQPLPGSGASPVPVNAPVGAANAVPAPGAPLPAASASNPLYGNGVAVIGLYGNRPSDSAFGRGYGGMDDQWGIGAGYGGAGYGGAGYGSSGLYGGGFDDYGMGGGPYGRSLSDGYGSAGSGASRYDSGQWGGGGSGRGGMFGGGPGGGRGGGGGWNL